MSIDHYPLHHLTNNNNNKNHLSSSNHIDTSNNMTTTTSSINSNTSSSSSSSSSSSTALSTNSLTNNADANTNLNPHLPAHMRFELDQLELELLEGDITQKGYDKKKAKLLANYLSTTNETTPAPKTTISTNIEEPEAEVAAAALSNVKNQNFNFIECLIDGKP